LTGRNAPNKSKPCSLYTPGRGSGVLKRLGGINAKKNTKKERKREESKMAREVGRRDKAEEKGAKN